MKLISKEMAKHLAEYHDAKKVSIEQELESGLVWWITHDGKGCNLHTVCTCIFLPVAKYEEWQRSLSLQPNQTCDFFYNIPVFSTNDTEITYCTD